MACSLPVPSERRDKVTWSWRICWVDTPWSWAPRPVIFDHKKMSWVLLWSFHSSHPRLPYPIIFSRNLRFQALPQLHESHSLQNWLDFWEMWSWHVAKPVGCVREKPWEANGSCLALLVWPRLYNIAPCPWRRGDFWDVNVDIRSVTSSNHKEGTHLDYCLFGGVFWRFQSKCRWIPYQIQFWVCV